MLFRYMRLSHCPLFRTSNTEAHADMYARAHLSIKVYGYGYTYPEDIKMLQCVGIMLEFARFHVAKHKALMTPLLCLQPPHPKDIIPRRGLITGAKVVNYFGLSKKIATFSLISVYRMRFLALLFRV